MNRLSCIIENVSEIAGHIAGWLVPLMMVLVTFEVMMRYIWNQPPMVADEFSGYMLVALCFLAMAYTWKEKGHVRITVLSNYLSPKFAAYLRLTNLVLAFAFSIALSYASYHYLVFSFKFHMSSGSWLQFPLQGPQTTVLIGYTLLSLLILVKVIEAFAHIKSGKYS
jgi:TRAP-type C4-dicarboxylate transport system permease small subunit